MVKKLNDLNQEKIEALAMIRDWLKQCREEKRSRKKLSKPYFYLAGYAGTGKSTLIKFLSQYLKAEIDRNMSIGYATYTGKAASVLSDKGIPNPSTIHSLIYSVEFDEETGRFDFFLDSESDIFQNELMVFDEVSMVNKEIGQDALSFDVPLLVVGDEGQLPPVGGTGYFTNHKPDFTLEEIHRQALESGIIRLSVDVRVDFENFNFKKYIDKYNDVFIKHYNEITDEEIMGFDLIAVGKHTTRKGIIKRIRKIKGEGAYPQAGSKIVFTRNNKHSGLFNGIIEEVIAVKKTSPERLCEHLENEIEKLNKKGKTQAADSKGNALKIIGKHPELHKRFLNVKVNVNNVPKWVIVYLGEFFQDATNKEAKDMPLFKETLKLSSLLGADTACYAYALTVHKLQGSQGDNLLLVDDGFGVGSYFEKDTRKRWLYTGFTRAAKSLTIATSSL